METVLSLSQGGFPLLSARGCMQELIPLSHGQLQRTLNGELIFVGDKDLQKFKTHIHCKDKTAPAFEGLWRGSVLNVGCIQELSQKGEAGQSSMVLSRYPVAESTQTIDENGEHVEFTCQGTTVTLKSPAPGAWFVTYRPLLTMMVTHFQFETDEWGMATGWSLSLEEV